MNLWAQPSSHAKQRVCANSRVVVPVSEVRRAIDPLLRPPPGASDRAVFLVTLIFAALLLHVLGVLVLYGVGLAARFGRAEPFESKNGMIALTVVERPPPEPEPESDPEPEPEGEPSFETKPQPKKQASKPPPPDPIDLPEEPPPPLTRPPPRRVVGLSLESTVGGGRGPAFVVGNSRMGRSDTQAVAPASVEKLTKPAQTNRIARRIPQRGRPLVKPKKLGRVRLEYPPELKAQNLESNVVVEAIIGVDGRVRRVRVIASSPYASFNTSAVKAAKQQRWSPARQGGQPVEFTVTYTVRFRLKD